jgi:hypothetical protein
MKGQDLHHTPTIRARELACVPWSSLGSIPAKKIALLGGDPTAATQRGMTDPLQIAMRRRVVPLTIRVLVLTTREAAVKLSELEPGGLFFRSESLLVKF